MAGTSAGNSLLDSLYDHDIGRETERVTASIVY